MSAWGAVAGSIPLRRPTGPARSAGGPRCGLDSLVPALSSRGPARAWWAGGPVPAAPANAAAGSSRKGSLSCRCVLGGNPYFLCSFPHTPPLLRKKKKKKQCRRQWRKKGEYEIKNFPGPEQRLPAGLLRGDPAPPTVGPATGAAASQRRSSKATEARGRERGRGQDLASPSRLKANPAAARAPRGSIEKLSVSFTNGRAARRAG